MLYFVIFVTIGILFTGWLMLIEKQQTIDMLQELFNSPEAQGVNRNVVMFLFITVAIFGWPYAVYKMITS